MLVLDRVLDREELVAFFTHGLRVWAAIYLVFIAALSRGYLSQLLFIMTYNYVVRFIIMLLCTSTDFLPVTLVTMLPGQCYLGRTIVNFIGKLLSA